jgi:hypothetical protein
VLIRYSYSSEVSMPNFPAIVRAVQIFALLSITVAIACGSSDEGGSRLIEASKGGTVEAVGGHVTIDVPAGALSEDTEITVLKVENDVTETGDLAELVAYEFGPDGTAFSKPIQVSLVLPVSLLEPGFRLVHLENAKTGETEPPASSPLEVQEVVLDDSGKNATILTSLTSFSSIKVYRSAFFNLKLTVPEQAVEGIPFQVEAVTRRRTTEPQVARRQVFGSGDDAVVETITIHPNPEWLLYGSYNGKLNVSPESVPFSPPETSLTTDTFTSQTMFTCTKAGSDFSIDYFAGIDVNEVWKFAYSPEDWEKPDQKHTSYEQHVKLASGECVAPEGDTSPTPLSALPTSTPDPLGQASSILLGDPTESPVTQTESDDGSSVSVQLPNGMTVRVEIIQWGGNPVPTLKRSWAGSVDFLRYTLNFTVSGEAEDGKRRQVEYQVFAVEPRGLLDWTDAIQKITGADAGVLEETLTLPWAGDYVVKGSVGEEKFELTLTAIEPEPRYGILAEPGTWTGRIPLTDVGASELADYSGEWSGWINNAWLQEIETVYSADVLKNQSKVKLQRTDRFIESLMTGVQQTTPDGGRTPYEMLVPRAIYEGTFSYNLPAFSYEDGHCGSEILTYEISGTVEYAPNVGPWSAPMVLNGTLSGPLPKLTREIPRTVQITVVVPDGINRQTLRQERFGSPIIGPLNEGAQLGFMVNFSDMERNTGFTINDESSCESYVTSIALVAAKQ